MVQIPQSPLILVDGLSYLYRAYHAFPPLTNSAGESTDAIYGILNVLHSLIMQYKPTHATVVFGTKRKTLRDELFEYCKSRRPPVPDGLRAQIESLHAMVKAVRLPLLTVPGVETDDVIGTLAHEAGKAGHPVLISTDDKDMARLVTPNIALISTMTNVILGPEEVVNKYGMPLELVIDFLVLMGGSSDNISGVPGVGEKTAQTLLQSLDGLDTLYARPEKAAGLSFRGAKTMAARLGQGREVTYLSYQLATIKTDIELELTCEQLEVQQPVAGELLGLSRECEFKRWTANVEAGEWLQAKGTKPAAKPQETGVADEIPEVTVTVISCDSYVTILSEEALRAWTARLEEAPVFAFGTGTDSLDNISANLVRPSFAIEPGVAAYIPVAYDYLGTSDQISRERTLGLLKPLLEDEKALKVGQNPKYDRGVLANYGIELREIVFDTVLESYIFNSVAGRHDMDSLMKRWLKHKAITFGGIAGKGRNQLTFSQIALEEAGRYAAGDADVTLQLHLKMWPDLQKHKGPLSVFESIKIPLVPMLSRIERNGVKINPKVLHNHSEELTLRLAELEEGAHEVAGGEFNPSSTKRLQTILFERQDIKPPKKTLGGAPSTPEKVLEELALSYPLPKMILEHRGLAKLKPAYTGRLPLMINPKTGRVHTPCHQTVTVTRRLLSTDPNLQNIPVRNEEGRRIHQAFIAPEDYVIVSTDYSQIELRIMAHPSHDKGLLTAFAKRKSTHRAAAVEVFDLPLEAVISERCRSTKAINFGLVYGMNAFGLTRQLSIPRKEAQKYVDLYFECYPGVPEYMEHTRAQAKEQGYVEMLDGRRLYLPDIKSSSGARRAAAERAAINAPMQRTAANIIKRAMIAVDAWLQAERPYVRMITQIHNEPISGVHRDDVDAVAKQIHQLVEDCTRLDVPLLVGVGSGENWDQAHQDSSEHALFS